MTSAIEKPVLLMTGSSGFIGVALGRALSDQYQIVGLDAQPPGGSSPGSWIEVDLGSDDSVRAALTRARNEHGPHVASVIHLAAYYDFSGEPSPLYDEITVRGTERLLRYLQELGFQVMQFVFSSTMLVHAPCEPGQHINEDWPVEPKWDYPRSKLETERLIQIRRAGIPVALLRIAGVYDDRCRSIPIANQIQRIYERRLTSKVFPGDASTGQSFVHLDDLVEAIRRVVKSRAALPQETVLLIGEPEPLSYDELQRTLGWLIHQEDWQTTRIPKAVAKTGAWVQDQIPGMEEPFIKPWMIDMADDHYALDISRARALLGWEPCHSLRATLPRMIDSLKTDPAGFYRQNKLQGQPPAIEAAPAEAFVG